MKIAFITEYRWMGGGETNLLRLIDRLTEAHEIGLFCASGKLLDRAKALRNARVSVFEIKPVRNVWRSDFPVPLYYPKLIRVLNKFDVVHTYSVTPLPMLIWCRRPIVWTVHGPWERPFGRRAWFIKHIIKKAVPVSSEVKRVLQLPASKVDQVPLGAISIDDIYPYYRHFDGSRLDLACIGSYQFVKGQDVLIDALLLLADRAPELQIRLWLVGDINSEDITSVEYKSFLLSKIEASRRDNIEILVEGFRSDVGRYIEESHLVVVPSRYESFSMVTIEALAKGKQVIAPDIGGPKEILDSPQLGYLFEPGDPDSICNAILKAIAAYPKKCPPQTLERAAHFTVEEQAEKLELIYQGLLTACAT